MGRLLLHRDNRDRATSMYPGRGGGDKVISEYFKESEFECHCGCGLMNIDQNLVYFLDDMRAKIGQPLIINSGCRCAEYNAKVGGKSESAHQEGKAVDVACGEGSLLRYLLVMYAIHEGFKRIGVAKSFVHLDMDESLPQNVLWTY